MKCFVVSPIGAEGTGIRKRSDQLFKHIIEPVCKECGLEAIRVDQLNLADTISQTIIDYLKQSELVIADMTDHNPNAFYEMGYRASTGKPIIHLKSKETNIPFDIAGIRAFDYDLTDLDAVEAIKDRLKRTINGFNLEAIVKENDFEDPKINSDDSNQVIPILYDIQDQILNLTEEIHKKDTETIQAIVKASQPVAINEDPTTSLMKAIMPDLIKNPSAFKILMEIGEQAENNKR